MLRHSLVRALPLLAVLVAAPLAADVIVMKDGSQVQIKGPYQIQKGKAVFTLLNGTRSAVDADKVDIKRTEEANRNHYGSATVLDQGTAVPSDVQPVEKQKSLTDLINKRGTNPRDLPPPVRHDVKESAVTPKTKSGFTDLSAMPRRPLTSPDVAAELLRFLHDQGVNAAQVWSGSQANHVLVEVQTGSEPQVFQALNTSANALLQMRDRHPQQVAALELLFLTPGGDKGGQFVLTPEQAADLVAKRIELAAYYVRNVQF